MDKIRQLFVVSDQNACKSVISDSDSDTYI